MKTKMRKLKRSAGFALAAGALVAAAACGGGGSSSSGDNSMLIVGIPVDQVGLNALYVGTGNTAPGIEGMFASLTERGDPFLTDGELHPGLITEFEPNEDASEWTLTMREGVKFHNGETMTIEDVQFSLELMASEEYEPTPSGSYFGGITETEIIDDVTLRVVFDEPDSLFYSNSPRAYVIPQAYYEEVGQEGFNRAPIAAGPYQFKEWRPDDVLILEAFDDYYGGEPTIQEVQFRVLPDEAARVAALRSGDIDIAAPLAIEQISTIEETDGLHVLFKDSLNRMYITIDTTVPPFDNRDVRLAVNHAIDRETIVGTVLEDMATIIPGGLVPELEPGANTDLEPYEYDPELAQSLLTQAGYPNGLEDEFGTIEFTCRDGYSPKSEEVCTIIAEQLNDAGFSVQPRMMENTAFETASAEKRLGPLQFSGHSGGGNFIGQHHLRSTKVCTERAGEVTTPLSPSEEWGGWYCNPDLDALVWEATQIWGIDQDRAEALISEAEAIMYDDAAAGFLWAERTAYGVRDGLNWEPPARPDFDFFAASWDE